MKNISEQEFKEIVKKAHSKSEICRQCGWHVNGSGMRRVGKLLNEYNLDIGHFDSHYQQRIYPVVEKICPVCDNEFKTSKGHPREKICCSHSCSNTYFRSGTNNGNYKYGGYIRGSTTSDTEYRAICFRHYSRKCVICGWDLVVEVHHIDGNSQNNKPENLIPLCPNHHKLTIMNKYKEGVNKQVVKIAKEKFGGEV